MKLYLLCLSFLAGCATKPAQETVDKVDVPVYSSCIKETLTPPAPVYGARAGQPFPEGDGGKKAAQLKIVEEGNWEKYAHLLEAQVAGCLKAPAQ